MPTVWSRGSLAAGVLYAGKPRRDSEMVLLVGGTRLQYPEPQMPTMESRVQGAWSFRHEHARPPETEAKARPLAVVGVGQVGRGGKVCKKDGSFGRGPAAGTRGGGPRPVESRPVRGR